MSEPSILIVRPGAIHRRNAARCEEAGIIVVETDDPASVRFVRAGVEMSSSAMLACAMEAMLATAGGTTQQMQVVFAKKIAEAVIDAQRSVGDASDGDR